MDIQQPLSLTSRTVNFSTQSKQQAARETVAQLLDDKGALDDWVANIEKIRRTEEGAVRHAIKFPTQSKQQQAAQKTVAQLLDDKGALDDWVANIGKIRRTEEGAVQHVIKEAG